MSRKTFSLFKIFSRNTASSVALGILSALGIISINIYLYHSFMHGERGYLNYQKSLISNTIINRDLTYLQKKIETLQTILQGINNVENPDWDWYYEKCFSYLNILPKNTIILVVE